MIKTEIITINNKQLKKTYSDNNKYIKKVGTEKLYSEAIDLLDSSFEYIETDIDIKEEKE